MRTLLPRVIEHFGGVDAVVNSASLFEHDNAQSFGFAALEKHLRSNTGAPIVLAQALHQHLQQRAAAGEADAHGAVVNLLDQKLWNQNPDFLSYTLSKAALEAAGTMLALALAPLVRVVGVAPGLTLTSHLLSDEKFQQLHALSPLGRSSTADDVASAVRFALFSRAAGRATAMRSPPRIAPQSASRIKRPARLAISLKPRFQTSSAGSRAPCAGRVTKWSPSLSRVWILCLKTSPCRPCCPPSTSRDMTRS